MQPYRRVCAYINSDAVIHNITNIRAAVQPDTKLMPVIKADGYGHGAVDMARLLVPFAEYFAVAIIEEAINLRENGIDKPILLLGYTSPEFFETAIKNNVTVTIFTLEDAFQNGTKSRYGCQNAYCGRYRYAQNRVSAR